MAFISFTSRERAVSVNIVSYFNSYVCKGCIMFMMLSRRTSAHYILYRSVQLVEILNVNYCMSYLIRMHIHTYTYLPTGCYAANCGRGREFMEIYPLRLCVNSYTTHCSHILFYMIFNELELSNVGQWQVKLAPLEVGRLRTILSVIKCECHLFS